MNNILTFLSLGLPLHLKLESINTELGLVLDQSHQQVPGVAPQLVLQLAPQNLSKYNVFRNIEGLGLILSDEEE